MPSCLALLDPVWRNWFRLFWVRNYCSIGLQNRTLNQCQPQILYVYDVYWLARWLLLTGSKYLEHISSIRIMHIDKLAIIDKKQMDKYIQIRTDYWYSWMNASVIVDSTYTLRTIYCPYIVRSTITLIRLVIKYSWDNKGLTMRSRDILNKPKGIILIESTKIRWFSRRSGRGGWSFLSQAKSVKTTHMR